MAGVVFGIFALGLLYVGYVAGHPTMMGIAAFFALVASALVATEHGATAGFAILGAFAAMPMIALACSRVRRRRRWDDALALSCWPCGSHDLEAGADGVAYTCRECGFHSESRQRSAAESNFQRLEAIDLLLDASSSARESQRALSSWFARFAGEFSGAFVGKIGLGLASAATDEHHEPTSEAELKLQHLWQALRTLTDRFPEDSAILLGGQDMEAFCEQSHGQLEARISGRTSTVAWAMSSGNRADERDALEQLHSRALTLRTDVSARVSAASRQSADQEAGASPLEAPLGTD